MDGDTFDTLVKRALQRSTRRGIGRLGIGALAATGLASLGLSATGEVQAKKKGKGKKKPKTCPPCKTRRNGKCQGNQPDDTPCDGTGRCLSGTCNPQPTCSGSGSSCSSIPCCAGLCGTSGSGANLR